MMILASSLQSIMVDPSLIFHCAVYLLFYTLELFGVIPPYLSRFTFRVPEIVVGYFNLLSYFILPYVIPMQKENTEYTKLLSKEDSALPVAISRSPIFSHKDR